MAAVTDLISTLRVNKIMAGLQDPRLIPQNLVWNGRIPDVDATDEEIMARWISLIKPADLILDDAEAVTYPAGRLQIEANKLVNFKLGVAMNQTQLNQLDRVNRYLDPRDKDILDATQQATVNNLLTSIRQRKEMVFIGMLTDNLNYDRLGVKLSGVTWGMPSDLKITPSVAWTSTSATPLTDIQNARLIAQQRYGVDFDFMQMSISDFTNMVKTTEFLNQAKLFSAGTLFSGTNLAVPVQNYGMMKNLAQQILMGPGGGPMTIEFYDNRYFNESDAGADTSSRFLPLGTVILTSQRFFGDADVWDFANGIVTETVVASLANGIIGNFAAPQAGPVSYVTTTPNLNPPGYTTWGVQRGFPRKKLLQSSAVLNVGAGSEVVTSGVPFPS